MKNTFITRKPVLLQEPLEFNALSMMKQQCEKDSKILKHS